MALNRLNDSGTLVYEASDDISKIIVFDKHKHRYMTFDSVWEQSCMNIKKPSHLTHQYARAMIATLSFLKPQHLTILGLGGGALLRSLHAAAPNMKIDAVELRPKVIDVCRQYFGIPKDSNINLQVSDGADYIAKATPNSTDIIFADMFDEYKMDPKQAKESFLQHCERALTDHGCLTLNLHRLPERNSDFFKNLHNIFQDTLICKPDECNYVLYASKAKLHDDLSRYQQAFHMLTKNIDGRAEHVFRNIIRNKSPADS